MATTVEEVISLPEVANDNNVKKIINPRDIDERMIIEVIDDKEESNLFLVIRKENDNGRTIMYGCYKDNFIRNPDLIAKPIFYFMTLLPFHCNFVKEIRRPTEDKRKGFIIESINGLSNARERDPKDRNLSSGGIVESLICTIH